MDSKFDSPISYFEAITALAFAAFAEHPIDVGVIEVGLGGEWDATNVVDADVAVIMPIGLDHTEYLGDTLTKIAATKAGIIKEGTFVVLAQQEPEAAVELLKKAAELGADIAREGLEYSIDSRALAVGGQLISVTGVRGHYDEIFLPLHGKHQASNAAAALIAVEAFFGEQDLDIDAVRAGFARVTSPGRCEVVHRDPTIILDAAHNPHGARAIAETVATEFAFDDLTAIVAVLGEKDALGILQELEPIAHQIIITTNSSPRAMSVADLEKIAVDVFGADRVFTEATLTSAVDRAVKDSVRPLSDDTLGILITGSVVTVGEARSIIRRKFSKEVKESE
jgi:dihydrofolate synthase/folylpolyglutamate synthase